jgi:hypothetical protein
LVECVLKVRGRQIIPAEIKTLTASEKVSVKPMPKGRFHEIYLDYLCGCVLRVAREVFALLPVDTVMVTAAADSLDLRTGQTIEQPVLSVATLRAGVTRLDFNRLSPPDAMDNFQHRAEIKASRKTEAFQPIIPLTPADIAHSSAAELSFQNLLTDVQNMRDELKAKLVELKSSSPAPTPQTNPTL